MRKTSDRIRHAVSFEVIALLLATPLGALAFDQPFHDMGVVTLVSATIAMVWNYAYNLGFDHALLHWRGETRKTLAMRLGHAALFEIGLIAVLAPFIAWYLGVSLLTALVMDAAFSGFYLIYAFAFNWTYDLIYPVPARSRPTN